MVKTNMQKKKSKGRILINMKVESKDLRRIRSNANRYADGNISAWLRYAGQKHVPVKTARIK